MVRSRKRTGNRFSTIVLCQLRIKKIDIKKMLQPLDQLLTIIFRASCKFLFVHWTMVVVVVVVVSVFCVFVNRRTERQRNTGRERKN